MAKKKPTLTPPKPPTPEECLAVLGEFARNLIVDPAYLKRVRNRAMDGKLDSKTEGMLISLGVMGLKALPQPDAPAPTPKTRKKKQPGKVVSITHAKEAKDGKGKT